MMSGKENVAFFFFNLFGCTGSLLQHVGSCSPTRDPTQAPALGAQTLSHWTTREVPETVAFEMHEEGESRQDLVTD